jgi:hypothetical protein
MNLEKGIGYVAVYSFCEEGDGLSDCMKGKKFCDHLCGSWRFKKGLCSKTLIYLSMYAL